MNRLFNPLTTAFVGNDEKRKICNIKFGINLKTRFKTRILKSNIKITI